MISVAALRRSSPKAADGGAVNSAGGEGLSDRRQGDSGDVDGAALIVGTARRPDGRVASLDAFPCANRRQDT